MDELPDVPEFKRRKLGRINATTKKYRAILTVEFEHIHFPGSTRISDVWDAGLDAVTRKIEAEELDGDTFVIQEVE